MQIRPVPREAICKDAAEAFVWPRTVENLGAELGKVQHSESLARGGQDTEPESPFSSKKPGWPCLAVSLDQPKFHFRGVP